METVRDFIFGGSKITADGDCSHEKMLASWEKSILKRDITLLTKIRVVRAIVFPVVTYGCESWTIKKAEHRRIDAFELCCWRRLLRGLWTARRSNQSILNIHWKGWCWNWSSSPLATWCKKLIHWKRLWCWEGLGAGGEGDNRGWDSWMASPIRWVWVNSRSWWWTGRPGMLQFVGLQWVGHHRATELNWIIWVFLCMLLVASTLLLLILFLCS